MPEIHYRNFNKNEIILRSHNKFINYNNLMHQKLIYVIFSVQHNILPKKQNYESCSLICIKAFITHSVYIYVMARHTIRQEVNIFYHMDCTFVFVYPLLFSKHRSTLHCRQPVVSIDVLFATILPFYTSHHKAFQWQNTIFKQHDKNKHKHK